jgi:hypothetical protein
LVHLYFPDTHIHKLFLLCKKEVAAATVGEEEEAKEDVEEEREELVDCDGYAGHHRRR